jgi:predicted Zn finger-like uncharacterized protein
MVVTCEKCATLFNLDASRLPPEGGNVRCTKCGFIFFIKPNETSSPKEPSPLLKETAPMKPKPKIEPSPLDILPDRIPKLPSPSISNSSNNSSLANKPLMSSPISPQQQRTRILLTSFIVLLGLLIGMVSLGTSLNPKNWSLLFRFGKKSIPTGIQILTYKAKVHSENPNQQTLWLDGSLLNNSPDSQRCPKLRLTLYSLKGEFLSRTSFQGCESSLGPQAIEKFSFKTNFPSPISLGSYQVTLEP